MAMILAAYEGPTIHEVELVACTADGAVVEQFLGRLTGVGELDGEHHPVRDPERVGQASREKATLALLPGGARAPSPAAPSGRGA